MKTRIVSNYSLRSEEACSTVSASAGNVPEIQTLSPYRRPVEHQEQGAAARSDKALGYTAGRLQSVRASKGNDSQPQNSFCTQSSHAKGYWERRNEADYPTLCPSVRAVKTDFS